MEPIPDTTLLNRLDKIEQTCAHGETQNGLFGLFYIWMPAGIGIMATLDWRQVTIGMLFFIVMCYIGVLVAMKAGISNYLKISQTLKEIERYHALHSAPTSEVDALDAA